MLEPLTLAQLAEVWGVSPEMAEKRVAQMLCNNILVQLGRPGSDEIRYWWAVEPNHSMVQHLNGAGQTWWVVGINNDWTFHIYKKHLGRHKRALPWNYRRIERIPMAGWR